MIAAVPAAVFSLGFVFGVLTVIVGYFVVEDYWTRHRLRQYGPPRELAPNQEENQWT